MVTKHCNTKIDSSPSANNETPQKFLWWIAIVKVWKQIFENNYYGFKRAVMFFIEILRSSMSYFIKLFKKITSILFLQISLRKTNDRVLEA